MPEQFFTKLKKQIKKEWIICFAAAMAFGLSAHIYKLVNWLPNWDSLVFRYDAMNMTHFGRWLLSAACGISSYYDLPWIGGLLSLLYISLGAVCVSELFGFKKNVTLILTGGLIASFPTVTSTLTYNYTADGYFLAFFLACLSVLLIERRKRGVLFGAVLIAFVLGIYQAYITVAVGLILLYLTDRVVFGKETVKNILAKTARFLTGGIAGAVLYWLIQNLIMLFSETELSEYQGVSEAFSLSGINFLHSFSHCRYTFKQYFFNFEQGFNLFSVLNILMFALIIAFGIYAFFKEKLYKFPGRCALAVLFVAAMPFGTKLLYFIECEIDYHNLMLMGYCTFYLFLLLFYERIVSAGSKFLCFKQWSIFIVMTLIVYNNVLIANISYHKLQIAYEKSYSAAVRISDRIEQTEDSEKCEKIAVIGKLPESGMYSSMLPPDMTGITDGYIIRETDNVIKGQNVLLSTLEDYCGLRYKDCSTEEIEKLIKEGVLDKMQPWPSKRSVTVYGDILIVYLGD